MSYCAEDLTEWSRNNNNFRRDISKIQKKIEKLRTHATEVNVNYFNSLKHRLDKLLVQDDLFWKQRAKTFWYREGDLNTKFFHAAATSRRKVNRIEHLQNSNGTVCRKEEELQIIARDYISHLFTKLPSTRADVISKVATSISDDDNCSLTAAFTLEEFKTVVFSMQADKCPGPDGFNPGFYQKFWDMCGSEIHKAGCEWLENGVFPTHLNSTNIALIPKGDAQTTMKDWQPIALCNVVYKMVAKVLANRLKNVLDKCISTSQSAFVPGRSILDNALVAIELTHYMKAETKGNQGDIALKLDISKAYDRLDWEYLRDIMF